MKKQKKRNIVEWAMHYRQIIILVTCCLVILGIFGLSEMKKNEFPDFTIRQGIVAAVYPGATAEEIEEQVTKPLENYIFSYKEVKKAKTVSVSKDGMVIIQVQLNDRIDDKDAFWNKFKHGVNDFKSKLPSGVLAIQVLDDFGDTSALLITMESDDKTYKELNTYMDKLKDRLRKVESVGRLNVYGMQKEQISVYLDDQKLSLYGLNDQTLAISLFNKGFKTTGGILKNSEYESPIYVNKSIDNVHDVQEMIVYSDPLGNIVRLKDIAKIVKEYPEPDSYITNNGKKCLLLSVEMKKDQNIVQMGEAVKVQISEFEKQLPSDIKIFKITDQSQVVSDSVTTFLKELVIAICAVIIVVMLLLPFRVAMVAASTIPITIFISLALFYVLGIELNTVTLAVLILTLGMIVDNSIVIIDSYLEKIGEGMSRWHASIQSATQFFKSILSATLAISLTFFPLLFIMTGMYKDFLFSFPWAITLVLMISLLVAMLLVPFMQFYFLREPIKPKYKNGVKAFSFFDFIQKYYNKLINWCFTHYKITIGMGVASVIIGLTMIMKSPMKLMPNADRNQFAVEIYLPTGTSSQKTAQVADSLEHILRHDKRVVSVASFIGSSSPRFQTSYAPQAGGNNFAQFIVNTTGPKETIEILDEYTSTYSNYFPEAFVRFKQLSYSETAQPIEIRLSGDSLKTLKYETERVMAIMRNIPELNIIRSDLNESLSSTCVQLDEEAASRLGITNLMVETSLAMRYGKGIPVATTWEDDYSINVILKSTKADSASCGDLKDELLPAYGGLTNVPLRQIAQLTPNWEEGQINRRNGVRTITISAEVERNANSLAVTNKIKSKLDDLDISKDITLTYGGELEETEERLPTIMLGLVIATVIIFFIMVAHFKRVSTAILMLINLALCLFGAAAGIYIQGIDLSVTSVLGVISLMGILVRNGIIMIDYAEELRATQKIKAKDAIFQSAQRRMRPIFLTSAAASMGVIPMILGGSSLWMPMGTVIFYGTLITLFFILTVLPVSYWLMMSNTTAKRKRLQQMERE